MPRISTPKDLERYPQDRRTVRWRGEYVIVLLAVAVLVIAFAVGR